MDSWPYVHGSQSRSGWMFRTVTASSTSKLFLRHAVWSWHRRPAHPTSSNFTVPQRSHDRHDIIGRLRPGFGEMATGTSNAYHDVHRHTWPSFTRLPVAVHCGAVQCMGHRLRDTLPRPYAAALASHYPRKHMPHRVSSDWIPRPFDRGCKQAPPQKRMESISLRISPPIFMLLERPLRAGRRCSTTICHIHTYIISPQSKNRGQRPDGFPQHYSLVRGVSPARKKRCMRNRVGQTVRDVACLVLHLGFPAYKPLWAFSNLHFRRRIRIASSARYAIPSWAM